MKREISNFVEAYVVAGSIKDEGGRWFFREMDDGYFVLISKTRQLNGAWWLAVTSITLTPSIHKIFMEYAGGLNE